MAWALVTSLSSVAASLTLMSTSHRMVCVSWSLSLSLRAMWEAGDVRSLTRYGNNEYPYTDQIPFQNETGTVLTSSSSFDLLVLIEPSYWDFHPNNPTYEYKINDWFEGYLDVFNVAPKPLVEWTMNNASIEGLTIRDVNGM